eukprot:1908593-Alexandrium_andersonii.AAC.1
MESSKHFAELLVGHHTSMEALVDKDRADNLDVSALAPVGAIDFDLFPNLADVACIFAHLRPMVGISEDCNGSALFKAAPLQCARLFHPVVCKSTVALQPPLQRKGGHFFEIYNGNGAKTDIPSYRD